jgi:hypothetical protein
VTHVSLTVFSFTYPPIFGMASRTNIVGRHGQIFSK